MLRTSKGNENLAESWVHDIQLVENCNDFSAFNGFHETFLDASPPELSISCGRNRQADSEPEESADELFWPIVLCRRINLLDRHGYIEKEVVVIVARIASPFASNSRNPGECRWPGLTAGRATPSAVLRDCRLQLSLEVSGWRWFVVLMRGALWRAQPGIEFRNFVAQVRRYRCKRSVHHSCAPGAFAPNSRTASAADLAWVPNAFKAIKASIGL